MKHLLRRDLSKRYGNLKNGVDDIKNHRFFETFQWSQLLAKKLDPPHIPHVEAYNILSNYPCSISEKESNFVKERNTSAEKVNKEQDPFLDW